MCKIRHHRGSLWADNALDNEEQTLLLFLLTRFAAAVAALARSLLCDRLSHHVEDIVQDVFVALLEQVLRGKLRCFEELARAECDEDVERCLGECYSWLTKVTYNKCMALLRKERRRASHALYPEPVEDAGPSAIELAETNAELRAALEQLPEKLREVIVLYYFGVVERRIKDLAAILDVNASTVKKRLALARELMRQALAPVADSLLRP